MNYAIYLKHNYQIINIFYSFLKYFNKGKKTAHQKRVEIYECLVD